MGHTILSIPSFLIANFNLTHLPLRQLKVLILSFSDFFLIDNETLADSSNLNMEYKMY